MVATVLAAIILVALVIIAIISRNDKVQFGTAFLATAFGGWVAGIITPTTLAELDSHITTWWREWVLPNSVFLVIIAVLVIVVVILTSALVRARRHAKMPA